MSVVQPADEIAGELIVGELLLCEPRTVAELVDKEQTRRWTAEAAVAFVVPWSRATPMSSRISGRSSHGIVCFSGSHISKIAHSAATHSPCTRRRYQRPVNSVLI